MGTKVKKQSIAEQLAELSNPRPVCYHPDQEDLDDLTAAKVCSFSHEEQDEFKEHENYEDGVSSRQLGSRRRLKYLEEEDVKYAGITISRKEFDSEFDGLRLDESNVSASASETDESLEESEEGDDLKDESSLSIMSVASDVPFDQSDEDSFLDQSDEETSFDQSDEDLSLDQSDVDVSSERSSSVSSNEQEPPSPMDGEGGDDITITSLASLQEDLEKGKAAEEQVALFDGALEARIRLQKMLTTCNRLPHPENLVEFQNAGGEQLEHLLKESRLKLKNLLDDLLELQKLVCSKNRETRSIVCGTDESGGDEEESDEEISSDFDDECETTNDVISSQSESEETESSTIKEKRLKRKRKRPEWVTLVGKRDYEGYIAKTHENFRPFLESTIDKWSKRTKLASGRIRSKAFMQVDHSVLSQIEHVLKDRERLVKRTQLKRSVYRVLGTDSEAAVTGNENGTGTDSKAAVAGNENGTGTDSEAAVTGNEKGTNRKTEGDLTDKDRDGPDTHLRDCDPEIFDDDDFYHQLLRELIERKMNYAETSDPTAMGRQWLELQKLRSKAKKKVDTKASKGRKIRYDVHPKLTNFMAPIDKGSLSDISRNDLFSSLFGARYST